MSSMVKRIARRNRVRIPRPRGHHIAGARTRELIDTALFEWRKAWQEWSEAIAEGRPARAPGYRPTREARL